MNKNKIINDPVYGFITIHSSLIFDLIEHPYFQRLRRIKQLGLTNYVYPGAEHTRFAHALGAMHLMDRTLNILKQKDVEISPEEHEAALVAILLHDVGHGPFSHTLEHTILPIHHEELSQIIMNDLNKTFDGALNLGIQIFLGNYPRKFFHQLVSSQLDMDRMDYLTRDSFFTGVSEGVIGYDRIIHMLQVVNDEIVVEEKGIYSIEKYLTARSIMYWQTYLHKTVLGAEKMLISLMERVRDIYEEFDDWLITKSFHKIMKAKSREDVELIDFVALDDHDVMLLVKSLTHHEDPILRILSQGIVNRNIFRTILSNEPSSCDLRSDLTSKIVSKYGISTNEVPYLLLYGEESNQAYTILKDQISILQKSGDLGALTDFLGVHINPRRMIKHYLCYPKNM